MGVVEKLGNHCKYSTNLKDAHNGFDIFILSSSIVACETEIKAINYLKFFKLPILVIGPFASTCPEKYIQQGANVLIGEPDTSIMSNSEILSQLTTKSKIIYPSTKQVKLEDLPIPSWENIFKNKKCF